jgi:hypothetical protein
VHAQTDSSGQMVNLTSYNTTWSFASREMRSENDDASADIDVVSPIPRHHLMIMVPAVLELRRPFYQFLGHAGPPRGRYAKP